jgi:IS605 OrfB family transposase
VGLRAISAAFVVAVPAGARVRTRLRVKAEDEAVLRATGRYLGSLAGRDLAARVREGWLDARGQAVSRRERKRALTAQSSSRWAGAITRTSEDQWGLAARNLRAERSSLQARVRRIEARLTVPVGGRADRACGYATPAERHAKITRLHALRTRLARAERRLDSGSMSVVRGGRALMRKRANLAAAAMTEDQWRAQWEAARMFLTADGEAGKAWGNETIRWNSREGWLEVRLPSPLADLANRPHGRYRLSCPVVFCYRGDEVAAQAATGAVRYDIALDPVSGRWYLDASWRTPTQRTPSLGELRQAPVVAVDVNAGHLAAAVLAPDGNVLGVPATILLDLVDLPVSTRDGRLRAAISELIATAKDHGARAIVIEDLDFTDARSQGRERAGNRPARGKRGRAFRRAVSGIPTGKFRGRLVQMADNAGLAVVAVDPAYTSRWGAQHWLSPLRAHHPQVSGHHAAAVVIGRRALGHRARRRAGVTGTGQRTSAWRTAPRAPAAQHTHRNGRPRPAPRQPPQWHKTATARRARPPDQAAHDRSGPPTEQISPLSDQER